MISTLRERGFIDAVTSEEIEELCQKPLVVYAGFDPTADSLHLGNLVGIIGLAWFQRFGHKVVAIVGGATGMIGDPSGKSVERNLLDQETLEKNLMGIRKSLEKVLNLDDAGIILNNFDWYKNYHYIDFLRDIGKHFRIGSMLAKDSVKSRLSSEEGLSYTEFSYQLLQAYDFLYLHDHHNVTVQIGGSDQWGNITAGTELIRKTRGKTAFGVTFPLITRSDGKKFGKSEEGAIWLNSEKLSSYDFYQYIFRIPDDDVIKLMKMLTFMPLEEIQEMERHMKESHYVSNTAQKKLAEEITRLVHGEEGLKAAQKITEAAAPGSKTSLDVATLEALSGEIPTVILDRSQVINVKLLDVLVATECVQSKGEAKRLIAGGGAYINNEKVEDEHALISEKQLIEGRFVLLGAGKKKKIILKIAN